MTKKQSCLVALCVILLLLAGCGSGEQVPLYHPYGNEYNETSTEVTLMEFPVYTMSGLAATPGCERLNLYTTVGEVDWSPVGKLSKLQELTVSACSELDIRGLVGATELEKIEIASCGEYRGEECLTPENFPALQTLTLMGLPADAEEEIRQAFVEHDLSLTTTLGEAVAFETLVFDGGDGCVDVDLRQGLGQDYRAELSALMATGTVRELTLSGGVCDLAFLRGVTGLEKLTLYETCVTDADLAVLFGMDSLVTVELISTPVTRAGLETLAEKLPGAIITAFRADLAEYYPSGVYDPRFAK